MPKKTKRDLVAIILAAGQGTRMNSQVPKVLHSVCGTAMIDHLLEAIRPLEPSQIFIVTGHLHEQVERHVGNRAVCVYQKERMGTAHAVKMVRPKLNNFRGDVLITCGDTPLIKTETLEALISRRRSHHTACVVLTTNLEDPKGYGRVVRNRDGTVRKIVEEKDTNTYEEKIQEINTGFYCYDSDELFWALTRVRNDNAQGEYYLTDTVEILGGAEREVEAHLTLNFTEVIGINSRIDMARAEKYLRTRILNSIMDQGVTIVDPSTTYIDNTVRIGIDTTIQPFTIIRGNTVIGEGCDIGPNVTVNSSRLGSRVQILNSVIDASNIDDDVTVGPYAHVREGSLLRENAKVGTFVEIARCDVGRNADVPHLAYLGDAHVGDESYIGAGALTCNFDGTYTLRTEIGKGVFVGSNSLLVAPVRIGDAARAEHNSTLTGTISSLPGAEPSTRERREEKSVELKQNVVDENGRHAPGAKGSNKPTSRRTQKPSSAGKKSSSKKSAGAKKASKKTAARKK